jgi:membrane-associated HD superfamily phosphohydrolase
MDQVQVLSVVCKKLNNDVELLAGQIGARQIALTRLSTNQKTQEDQLRQLNTDAQIKLSRTDVIIQQLQSNVEQISHGLRDAIKNQQEFNNANGQRYQELKAEVEFFIFVSRFLLVNGKRCVLCNKDLITNNSISKY